MAQNPDGLVAEMQGSKNPLLLRNYRFIAPSCWKYINLVPGAAGQAVGPGPTFLDDLTLQFKIEAAPVVLTYESELVFRIKCPLRNTIPPQPDPHGAANYNDVTRATAAEINDYMVAMLKHSLLRGYDTRRPLFRTKLKAMCQMVKRAWATLSNMTFQSVNTPQYINEILLRRSFEEQRKYPDNYTMEYSNYLAYRPVGGVAGNGPVNVGVVVGANLQQPANYEWGGPGLQNFGFANAELNPPQGGAGENRFRLALGRRGAQWTPWDNISFSTPAWSEQDNAVVIDFRIPLTELLPVFKIGVIPCMMINSSTFDLMVDIYHPKKWFVSTFFDCPRACEVWLNITTVSFPDINPLAEMLLKPHIAADRFVAPYLDYFTIQNTYDISDNTSQDFLFNVIQFFRNVPFISISFVDITTPAYRDPEMLGGGGILGLNAAEGVQPNLEFIGGEIVNQNLITGEAIANVPGANRFHAPIVGGEGPFMDFDWGLNYEDRVRGGFYNLPPGVKVENLDIRLGESAYPLTQVPIDFNSMYMYNRKHFEMYGRTFNVTRVSPIARHMQGDASYFFDLSHGPMSGFTIDSDSPLQIRGTLTRSPLRHPDPAAGEQRSTRIVVLLTIWYSNNFNAMLNSGGVVPLQ